VGPHDITSNDFNLDGYPDLAIPNYVFGNTTNLSIILNNGDGTFGSPVTYAAGEEPWNVTSGDYDSDGDPDVILSNNLSGTLSYFLNNGNGTFATQVIISVGNLPVTLINGDFDGDGDVDIISANNTSESISILFNINESPIIESTFPQQNELNVLLTSDITVTFNLEMDVVSFDSSTFVVHASQTGLHKGSYSYNAATKSVTLDVNDDFTVGENVDITLTTGIKSAIGDTMDSPYTWSFTIEVEDGSGVFAEQVTYDVGFNPLSIASSDLDGDDDQDLAVTNWNSGNVSVLLNNGDGTFTSQVTYSVGLNPKGITSTDLDGDGDQDLAVINEGVSTVSILLNNGNGTFGSHMTYAVGLGAAAGITSSDLDGDGDQDLAVANVRVSTISVLLNNGDGTFTPQVTYSVGIDPSGITSTDLDGDGDQDLAVTNWGSGNVSVLLNNGDGTFASQVTYSVGSAPHGITSSDLNGDGDQDLAVANWGSDNVSVLLNNGDGTFAMQVTNDVGDGVLNVASSDLDGDGDQDLSVTNNSGFANSVSVLLNNGNGTFASQVTYEVGSRVEGITVADLDGDGDIEITVTNGASTNISILFNRSSTADITVSPISLNFGDVNIGDSLSMRISITNTGLSTLDVTSMTLTNSEFSVEPPIIFQVASGATLNKLVNFHPKFEIGPKVDTLNITSNATNQPIASIALSGMGITPPLYGQIGEFKITGSSSTATDKFGFSVALSGDYAIVGASGDDDNDTDAGAAYVFKRDTTNWMEQIKLLASDGFPFDEFGYSVGISGDYAVVGSFRSNFDGGSIYVFKRDNNLWLEESIIIPVEGLGFDAFGHSVAISGDYIIAGAHRDGDNGSLSGAAYIFKRSGTVWKQESKLLPPSLGAIGDWFGWSVDISGDYAIIGARLDDVNGTNSGSAYIFKRDGSAWQQETKLLATDGSLGDDFGVSVSISGTRAIVGAHGDEDGGAFKGSAYLFKRNGSIWQEETKLLASDGTEADEFGESVSISGDYVIVGAHQHSDRGVNSGSAYLYMRNGSSWTEIEKLLASDGEQDDQFGESVSISGDYVVVGAYRELDNGEISAAYLFNGTVLSSKITVNPDTLDFGGSIDQLYLTISNLGNADLIVSDINLSSSVFNVSDTSLTIEPDSSFNLLVTFTPNRFGFYNDTLTVFSNDPFASISVVLLQADVQSIVNLNPLPAIEQSGDITIEFSIENDKGNLIDLIPEYSVTMWELANSTGTISNLAPSSYNGSFVWNSDVDLPGVDLLDIKFRTTPIDQILGIGFPGELSGIHLDNNLPPEMISLTIPPGELSGIINISLISSDAEDDTLNYIYDFSSDSGATWNTATMDEPISQLSISIQNNLHESELSESSLSILDTLSINWHSANDLFNQDLTSVVFRISPAITTSIVSNPANDLFVV